MHGLTLVFDLDGTLVDTAPDLVGATNHVLAGLGAKPLPGSKLNPWISHGARRMIVEAVAARGIALGEADTDRARDRFLGYYPAHRARESGPVPATRKLLDKFGLTVDDIDYFEINEAFAAVNIHAERELGVSRDRTNLYGGGISIGHPPGATGLRMLATAIDHLKATGQRYAVITMCIGGGQGMAGLIENMTN